MKSAKQTKHQALNNALVAYAKAGGTVIFGCQCSNHVTPPDLRWYFSTIWNLPWQMGSYARFDFKPSAAVGRINGKALPEEYNVKAVQLKDVDKDSVVYREQGESYSLTARLMQQGMLGPQPQESKVRSRNSGPVIWKKYADGWVGWLGDVNNEEGTRQITMMMCGL